MTMIILMILGIGIIILMIAGINLWIHVKNFNKAKSLENEGKYKDAIYNYATAILTGSFWKNTCYKKIKQLSQKYGPFNFDEILEKELKEQGKAPGTECIESGHAETVKLINEIINKPI